MYPEKKYVDGLTFIVLPTAIGEGNFAPTDSSDYDSITNIIKNKKGFEEKPKTNYVSYIE